MHKFLFHTVFTLLTVLVISSCSGYSSTGKKFLDNSFGNNTYEAKELLSSSLSYGQKNDFMDIIKEVKSQFSQYSPFEFKYRSGYKYKGLFGQEYATAFYTFNDNKEHIVFLGFDKDDGKWLVDDIGSITTDELINRYVEAVKKNTQAKEGGDKDRIKSAEKDMKDYAQIVKSIKDILSESQMEKFTHTK